MWITLFFREEVDHRNFSITGKLAEDTNMVNGVVVKYSEVQSLINQLLFKADLLFSLFFSAPRGEDANKTLAFVCVQGR